MTKEAESTRSMSPNPSKDTEKQTYQEAVQKRLKTLKKRLGKIEKNEEAKAKGVQLNADQLQSIAQKPEVLFAIHELEELAKSFVAVDEEYEKEAERQKLVQLEKEKEIRRQAKEEETRQRRKDLENYYILLHVMDPNLQEAFQTNQIEEFSLTQDHIETLIHIYSQIFPKFEQGARVDQTVAVVFENALKLFNKVSEELRPGISYGDVYDLLESIKSCSYFDPDVAARIAEEKAAREAEELRKKIDLEENYELIDPKDVPIPSLLSLEQVNGPRPVTFQFMTDSELGEEIPQPLSSFDIQAGQQPTVIVPVPEKLLGQPRLAPWAKKTDSHHQQHHQQHQQHQHHHQQHHQAQQTQTQPTQSNETHTETSSSTSTSNAHSPATQTNANGAPREKRQNQDRNQRSKQHYDQNQQQGQTQGGDGTRRSSAYAPPSGQSNPRPRNTGNYRTGSGQDRTTRPTKPAQSTQ